MTHEELPKRSRAETITGVAAIPGILLANASAVCLVLRLNSPAIQTLYAITIIALIPLLAHMFLRYQRTGRFRPWN